MNGHPSRDEAIRTPAPLKVDDGGPAFPRSALVHGQAQTGMSQRAVIAALSMAGDLAAQGNETGEYYTVEPPSAGPAILARRSVIFADALLRALGETS